MFGREPFDLVTVGSVAALAGVSKMTVYSHFRDKETLFETVVSSISAEMIAGVSSADMRDGSFAERLTAIGRRFLWLIVGPETVMIAHTLPAVLRGNPALAQRFYDAGPGRVREALAGLIASAADQGLVRVDDPVWAASDLMGLWEGGMPAQLAFGIVEPMTMEEITRRVQRGTGIFLRAYGMAARRARKVTTGGADG